MGWLQNIVFGTTGSIGSYGTTTGATLNNLTADIHTWGGNVDAGGNSLVNCAGVVGPTGRPLTPIGTAAYNFSPQTPGGTLAATSGQVITLSPMPAGITAASAGNCYLYISGGTGTAEYVLITAVGSSTVTVTCSQTHSGAWTIQSATSGLQEACMGATGSASHALIQCAGDMPMYGPLYLPNTLSGSLIQGPGTLDVQPSCASATALVKLQAGLAYFMIQNLGIEVNHVSAIGTVLDLSQPETSTHIKLSRVYVDDVPNNCTIVNMDGNEDSVIEDSIFVAHNATNAPGVIAIKWHVIGGGFHMRGNTSYTPIYIEYQVGDIIGCTSGPIFCDGVALSLNVTGGYIYSDSVGLFQATGSNGFGNVTISGTYLVAVANNVVAFHTAFTGGAVQWNAFLDAGIHTGVSMFSSATTGFSNIVVTGIGLANGAVQGTPASTIHVTTFDAYTNALPAMNYIVSETGSNGAIAGSLGGPGGPYVVPNDGMLVTVLLSHTLTGGSSNTFSLNGLTAYPIRSSRNPANNIATGYAVAGRIILCWNGLGNLWEDMSQ